MNGDDRRRHNFRRLIDPQTIAFIGGDIAEAGVAQTLSAGFDGRIVAVNPRRRDLAGISCHKLVTDLDVVPDAAFVAVSKDLSLAVVEQLSALGTGVCICHAAGYAEAGPDGRAAQQALLRASGDMIVIGPNSYGFLNYVNGTALWPGGVALSPRPGPGVAILSQSGNVALNAIKSERSIPFSHILSVGNQAGFTIAEGIEHMLDACAPAAIGLYMEGIVDAARFERAAETARERHVPILALKVGRGNLSSQLALSHSASIAGDDAAFDAFFARTGVVRLDSFEGWLEALKLFALHSRTTSDRLAIFTCSGGDSLMSADTAERLGIPLPQPPEDARNALRHVLPDYATIANPLDYNMGLWGDRQGVGECVRTMLDVGGYDGAMLIIDTPRHEAESANASLDGYLDAMESRPASALVASALPELFPAYARERVIARGGVPMQGIDDALAALAAHRAWLPALSDGPLSDRGPVAPLPMSAGGREIWSEARSKHALAQAGLSVPTARIVEPDAALAAAEAIGFPVAVKIAEPFFAHKSEVGGVHVNIETPDALVKAVQAMASSLARYDAGQTIRKLLVERHITDAVAEFVIGIRRDESFGHCLIIGLGGTLVEWMRLSATVILPASAADIRRQLTDFPAMRLLQGFRGRPRGDIDALVEAAAALGRLALAFGDELIEADVNPLMVLPEGRGAIVADALIVTCEGGSG